MALIKCSECGKEISDKATSCIHCGNPIKRQKKELRILDKWFIILFPIIVFLGFRVIMNYRDFPPETKVQILSILCIITYVLMLFKMKKSKIQIILSIALGIFLFTIIGMPIISNKTNYETNESTSNENIQEKTPEKTQEEKNEEMYLQAKEYYNNKEYSYAYQWFNYVRDYKDTNEILNSDKYFKMGGNKYQKTTSSYSISFDFTSGSTLYITYVTHIANGSEYGACKIVDNRIYLEEGYQTGIYKETDWYITNVRDDSIVVKLKNTSYTLNKK